MTIDSKSRRRTKAVGNAFFEVSFSPDEAKYSLARTEAHYEQDDSPLSKAQVRQIRKQVPQGTKRSMRSHLAVVFRSHKTGSRPSLQVRT